MKCRLLLFAALLSFVAPAPAWAHSTLTRSAPKDGAVLQKAPNEIKLWFTEPLKLSLSTFEVSDQTGRKLTTGTLLADPKEPAHVHLPLPKNLGPGSYRVSWTAVAEDMHVSKGSFTFRVAS